MSKSIATAVLSASLVFAGATQAAPVPKKTSVTLTKASWVGSTLVPAGQYKIELASDPDTARLVQGKHTVAEAPVKVGLERAVYAGNAIHYRTEDGKERIVKIVLAPSGLALEFGGDAAAEGPSAVATSADRD